MQEAEERLRKESERLQTVLDVTSLLSSNWDVPLVFPRISASIRRVLRQEFASFVLHDPGTGLLVRQAIDFPLGKGLIADMQVVTGRSPAGRSMEERATQVFSKKQLQAFEDEIANGFVAEGLESVCCVPLMRPKGPLGVLVIGSTRENAFLAEDLQLVNHVASQ